MAEYIWTLEELNKVNVGNLGPMDQGTYDSYMQQAQQLAAQHGIERPSLIIDIKFKAGVASQFGVTEQPYPISRDEWSTFVSDARTMAEYMPNVFVVDGKKFTAPI